MTTVLFNERASACQHALLRRALEAFGECDAPGECGVLRDCNALGEYGAIHYDKRLNAMRHA